MKYRIVYRNDLFYPQVGIKFLWWYKWYKIGVHTDGFGLYYSKQYTHGLTTQEEAQKIINKYHTWNLRECYPMITVIKNVIPKQ